LVSWECQLLCSHARRGDVVGREVPANLDFAITAAESFLHRVELVLANKAADRRSCIRQVPGVFCGK
jgi:hypothetical protein